MFFFCMRYDMTMTAFSDLGGGFGGVSGQGLGVVGGGGSGRCSNSISGGVRDRRRELPTKAWESPARVSREFGEGVRTPQIQSKIEFKIEFKTESKIESKPGPKLNSICLLFKVN